MTDLELLRDDCVRLLNQGASLVRELDDESYARLEPVLASSIGGHLRHSIDFCERFLEGFATGRIDYDRRARVERIECDRDFACEALASLAGRLREVDLDGTAPQLKVALDAGDDPIWTDSSIGRELVALSSHTIHHYALIAVALRRLGRTVPEGFGVAPSTLRHWAQLERCAP